MIIDERLLRMRLQDRSKFTDEEYNNLKQMFPDFGLTYIKILEYQTLDLEKEDKIDEITQELDYLSNLLQTIDDEIDDIQSKKNEYEQLQNDYDQTIINDSYFKDQYRLNIDKMIISLNKLNTELMERKYEIQKMFNYYNEMYENYTTLLDQLRTEVLNWYSTYTTLTTTTVEQILIDQRSWI